MIGPDEHDGVPDDLRWALEVLREAAPPRDVDEGHYANRTLVYLERLESRLRGEYEYASSAERRRVYDVVAGEMRRLTNCYARREAPGPPHPDAGVALAKLAVLANVSPAL